MSLKTLELLQRQDCLRLSEKGFLNYYQKQESPSGNLLYYKDVPRDFSENCLWRAWLWSRMRSDAQTVRLVEASCRNDIRFYVASFCFTSNTRNKNPVTPFVPYDFQAVLLSLLQYNVEQSLDEENRYRRWDVGIDKSRDMGATWSVLYFVDWVWRFWEHRDIICISAKEDLVEGGEKSLFRRLDYNEERLPVGLNVRGAAHDHMHGRPQNQVNNLYRANQVEGESANPDAGRQGRYLIAVRDEEAAAAYGAENTRSLNQTTRMQVRISTPAGTENSFYRAKTAGGIDWITLHWTLHPEKARGLYTIEGGRPRAIDVEWHNSHTYAMRVAPTHADPGAPWEFLRSPWFDGEVDAADSFYDIMQEIQISYLGTGSPFFRADRLSEMRQKNVREPVMAWSAVSDIFYEPLGINDRDMRPDKARLWTALAGAGEVAQNTTYSMGVDVAAGTGAASDSVISVGDDATGEKVFEYASNGITPEDLARVTAALYEWFTTPLGVPFIAWDLGGHGQPFGHKFLDLCPWADVYYHINRDERGGGKRARKPGVPSNRALKLQLMTDYRDALLNGDFASPSVAAYDQAGQFVHDGKGGVVHVAAASADDKAAAGEQHGDVASSEAILVLAMLRRTPPKQLDGGIPNYECMARRKMLREREALTRKETWY